MLKKILKATKKIRHHPTYTKLFLRTRARRRIRDSYQKLPKKMKNFIKLHTTPEIYTKIYEKLSYGQVPDELRELVLKRFDKKHLKDFEKTYFKDPKKAYELFSNWIEF